MYIWIRLRQRRGSSLWRWFFFVTFDNLERQRAEVVWRRRGCHKSRATRRGGVAFFVTNDEKRKGESSETWNHSEALSEEGDLDPKPRPKKTRWEGRREPWFLPPSKRATDGKEWDKWREKRFWRTKDVTDLTKTHQSCAALRCHTWTRFPQFLPFLILPVAPHPEVMNSFVTSLWDRFNAKSTRKLFSFFYNQITLIREVEWCGKVDVDCWLKLNVDVDDGGQ